jgi:hypothetical protein
MPKRKTSELEIDEANHKFKLLCVCGRDHVVSQKEKDVILTTDETGADNGETPKNPDGSEPAKKDFLSGFFSK